MQDIQPIHITTERIALSQLQTRDVEMDVLRLDNIHPLITGNKWFKLRYYLDDAKATNKKTIITRGGAWSNHIIATAAACKLQGFASIGIIRGEPAAELSPTLLQAKEMGMQLIFITREEYRNNTIPNSLPVADFYFIPEGGYGLKGAAGAATISDHIQPNTYTHIFCATGTGTMAAGLLSSVQGNTLIMAVSALKNHTGLENDIRALQADNKKTLQVFHDYHFGGYAKYKPGLINFMNDFYLQTKIRTDFVYTAKAFFAAADLANNKFFPAGSKLLLIHSGGLQGNASLSKGTLIF